jgi:hypothetical protein
MLLLSKASLNRYYLIMAIVSCAFLAGCYNCDCYNKKKYTSDISWVSNSKLDVEEIETPHLGKIINSSRPNAFYGFHLLKKADNYFLMYVSGKSSLTLSHLRDTSIKYRLDLTSYFGSEQYPALSFLNDTICIFQPTSGMLSVLFISDSYGLTKLQTYHLNLPSKKRGDFYVMHNPGSTVLSLQYPFLLMAYGSRLQKNYIDSTAYLMYNLQSGKYRKMVNYPTCYKHCGVYNYQSHIATYSNKIYCVFEKHDDIYQFASDGNLMNTGEILHDCKLEEFDVSRKQDLAYVRKHQMTGESNVRMLADSNENLLIVKFLKSESLSSPRQYEGYIFDKHLNYLTPVRFHETIYPDAIMSYSDGFLAFSEDFNKAYYYVVKHL